MNFVTPGVTWRGTNALYIARKLGQTANLRLCLDPGAKESYDGSGQTFADLSGGGNDYYRGTTSGSESTDPTFNGTAGRLTSGEYFSTDGADRLTLVSGSNPSWIEQVHQTGAKFTFAAVMKVPSPGGVVQLMCGDRVASGTRAGHGLYLDTSGHFSFIAVKPTNTIVKNISMAATSPAGAFAFYGISLDETAGANGCAMQVNSTVEKFTSTYTSPTTDVASALFEIFNGGGGTLAPVKNGGGLGPFWFWDRALKSGEMMALFNAIRGRFGL